MKSSYNERFSFDDPKQSACRSTKHRAAKRKATEWVEHDNAEICEPSTSPPTATMHLSDDLAPDTQEYMNMSVQEVTAASQSQDSLQQSEVQHSDRPFLNVDDFPLALEYSSLSTDNEPMHIMNDPGDFECYRQEDSSDATWNPQQSLPLYEGSSLTCASSCILLMKYAMKHNITKDALADLLELVRLHCPKPNTCPPTLYYFNKQFENLKYPVKFHYFCSECFYDVTDPHSRTGCGNPYCKNVLSEKTVSSFIEIPIDLQLKSILERKNVNIRI